MKIKEQNNFSNLVKIGVVNTEEFVRSKVGFWTFERRINEPQIKLNQSSTYYAMASIRYSLWASGIRRMKAIPANQSLLLILTWLKVFKVIFMKAKSFPYHGHNN